MELLGKLDENHDELENDDTMGKDSKGHEDYHRPYFMLNVSRNFLQACGWIAVCCFQKVKGGREGRPIGAYELAKAVEDLGAGEILLNCIDCDGNGPHVTYCVLFLQLDYTLFFRYVIT